LTRDDPRNDVEPQVKQLFDLLTPGRATRVLGPAELRAGFDALAPLLSAGAPEVARDEEIRIPGPAGAMRAVLHAPKRPAADRAPILLYLHGGGWVAMSPETHARLTKELCARSGAIVVSLEYRLAPESRYPAQLDDTLAAYRWLRDHAEELGGDPARIGIAGDSAGGNLSAAASLRLLANAEAPPRCIVLICPILDAALDTPSYLSLAPDDPVLDDELMRFFRDSYVSREQWDDPFVSPLGANLEGFPPTCIVAGQLDPLHDDGVRFAERLRAAGRDVELHDYPGMPHIFMVFPGIDAEGRAVADMTRFLGERL
jgi:acetyl esterase